MPSKPEDDGGAKGARRTRAKTPLYKGKRKHDGKPDEDGDNASDSGAGLKPSAKHSSRDKRDSDAYVSPRDSKQRHGSRPRAAAAMRKSILKFEDKVRGSRSRTPKPRPSRKEGDDSKAGERSAARSLSRARKHESARSPSTTRKKLDESSSTSPTELNKKKSDKQSSETSGSGDHAKDNDREDSKQADKLRPKKKESFHLHRTRSTEHPSGPGKEDSKQVDKPRSRRKVEDHKVHVRSSMNAGRSSEPSAFKLKRRESRDDLCLLISKQADLRRNNSFNESTFSDLIADLRKDKSESKEKHHDSKDRPARRKPAIERRHSDETGKSLIIDRKEVIARRNSMTENKDDLLRQSKRLSIPRSNSMGSLKKSIGSADSDAINAHSTSGKRSESKAGTKDNTPSSKDTPARPGRKSIPEAKAPSKATVKEIPPLRTISKENTKEDQKKDERKPTKPPIETAAPVPTPAAVAVIPESKGIRISRLTMCAVCVLYIVSLAVVGVVGFWLHMIFFSNNQEQPALDWSFGIDAKAKPAESRDEAPLGAKSEIISPSLSPASLLPTISYAPSSSTGEPSIVPNQLLADSKRPPPSSVIPTISLQPTSSPPPTISHNPSVQPSYMPSTSFPTFSPSTSAPTLSRMPSLVPSTAPSTSMSPSSSPTGIPKCPDKLLKIADLGEDSLITMRYEIIPLPLSDPYGGLFCVSIEHKGNAGWIGFAVSEASRDPAFGRKEAIIGIPGVMSMVAAAPPGADVAVGQQVGTSVLDGPTLFNPGKYEIPAGGVDGYAGPSIDTMLPPNRQTLGNATVAIIGPDDNPLQKPTTTMTFTKFLREPNEIEIDPFKSTLFVYAVATIDEDGEYNDNPEWLANYITLLESEATTAEKKRLRHHQKM
eukprot:CCRYP_013066-RA/>CCRYP_013066-RA protein AED:0.01 eAED:0.01 QI:456/1/1/1/0/0/2/438/883